MNKIIFNNFKKRFMEGQVPNEDTWTFLPVNSTFIETYQKGDIGINYFDTIYSLSSYNPTCFNGEIGTGILSGYNAEFEYTKVIDDEEYSNQPLYINSANAEDWVNKYGLAFTGNSAAIAKYTGSGFYFIRTKDELTWFANQVNQGDNSIIGMMGDGLEGVINTYIGTEEYPFEGILDGNGYSLKNIQLQCTGTDNGLVGVLGKNGLVCNFKLENDENFNSYNLNCGKKINLKHLKTDARDINAGMLVGRNYGTVQNILADYQNDFTFSGFVPEVYSVTNKSDNYTFSNEVREKFDYNKENYYYLNSWCIDSPGNLCPYVGYFAEGYWAMSNFNQKFNIRRENSTNWIEEYLPPRVYFGENNFQITNFVNNHLDFGKVDCKESEKIVMNNTYDLSSGRKYIYGSNLNIIPNYNEDLPTLTTKSNKVIVNSYQTNYFTLDTNLTYILTIDDTDTFKELSQQSLSFKSFYNTLKTTYPDIELTADLENNYENATYLAVYTDLISNLEIIKENEDVYYRFCHNLRRFLNKASVKNRLFAVLTEDNITDLIKFDLAFDLDKSFYKQLLITLFDKRDLMLNTLFGEEYWSKFKTMVCPISVPNQITNNTTYSLSRICSIKSNKLSENSNIVRIKYNLSSTSTSYNLESTYELDTSEEDNNLLTLYGYIKQYYLKDTTNRNGTVLINDKVENSFLTRSNVYRFFQNINEINVQFLTHYTCKYPLDFEHIEDSDVYYIGYTIPLKGSFTDESKTKADLELVSNYYQNIFYQKKLVTEVTFATVDSEQFPYISEWGSTDKDYKIISNNNIIKKIYDATDVLKLSDLLIKSDNYSEEFFKENNIFVKISDDKTKLLTDYGFGEKSYWGLLFNGKEDNFKTYDSLKKTLKTFNIIFVQECPNYDFNLIWKVTNPYIKNNYDFIGKFDVDDENEFRILDIELSYYRPINNFIIDKNSETKDVICVDKITQANSKYYYKDKLYYYGLDTDEVWTVNYRNDVLFFNWNIYRSNLDKYDIDMELPYVEFDKKTYKEIVDSTYNFTDGDNTEYMYGLSEFNISQKYLDISNRMSPVVRSEYNLGTLIGSNFGILSNVSGNINLNNNQTNFVGFIGGLVGTQERGSISQVILTLNDKMNFVNLKDNKVSYKTTPILPKSFKTKFEDNSEESDNKSNWEYYWNEQYFNNDYNLYSIVKFGGLIGKYVPTLHKTELKDILTLYELYAHNNTKESILNDVGLIAGLTDIETSNLSLLLDSKQHLNLDNIYFNTNYDFNLFGYTNLKYSRNNSLINFYKTADIQVSGSFNFANSTSNYINDSVPTLSGYLSGYTYPKIFTTDLAYEFSLKGYRLNLKKTISLYKSDLKKLDNSTPIVNTYSDLCFNQGSEQTEISAIYDKLSSGTIINARKQNITNVVSSYFKYSTTINEHDYNVVPNESVTSQINNKLNKYKLSLDFNISNSAYLLHVLDPNFSYYTGSTEDGYNFSSNNNNLEKEFLNRYELSPDNVRPLWQHKYRPLSTITADIGTVPDFKQFSTINEEIFTKGDISDEYFWYNQTLTNSASSETFSRTAKVTFNTAASGTNKMMGYLLNSEVEGEGAGITYGNNILNFGKSYSQDVILQKIAASKDGKFVTTNISANDFAGVLVYDSNGNNIMFIDNENSTDLIGESYNYVFPEVSSNNIKYGMMIEVQ